MQRYSDNFIDSNGRPVKSASVLVRTYPAGMPATLYSDNGVTPTANPTTTDALGLFSFYAPDGRYSITITSDKTEPVTRTDIQLEDPTDTPAVAKSELAAPTGAALIGHGAAVVADVLPTFPGRGEAVAGSKMKIDFLKEASSYKLEDEAGIWALETYAYAAYSKEFTASSLPTGGPSPASTLFAFANSNGSTSDVVAVMGNAVARQSNSIVFGANFIARNGAGVNGAKLVGLEIDMEPAAGTTIASGSIGLAINAFSIDMPAPAIQLGGLGNGTFANGIVINAVKGSALAAQSGSTQMQSLIDASQGSYASDAVILGNGHKLRLMGTSSTHAKIYNDSANNVRMVLGTGSMVIRNSADTASLFTFDATGGLTLGNVKVAGNQVLTGRIAGWSAMAGTASKGGFDTATVTLPQLAQVVKALVDAGIGHGFIGA